MPLQKPKTAAAFGAAVGVRSAPPSSLFFFNPPADFL
jgi:hypothetical protein